MTGEQHRQLLAALGDILTTLDAVALDTQALREHAWGSGRDGDPQPPSWVNQDRYVGPMASNRPEARGDAPRRPNREE